jgi:hypothetical protein
MRSLWEKFNLQFSSYDLEFVTIRSLRQLRPFRNLYNLDLGLQTQSSDVNLVFVVEKRLNAILGFFRCQVSARGGGLKASERFDTFPVERLDLSFLEITEFQIADAAWGRLGFRTALGRGVLNLMNELSCDGLLLLCQERVTHVESFLQQFRRSPFRSEFVRCGRYQGSESLDESGAGDVLAVEQNVFSSRMTQLLCLGLEIWSDPIVYQNRETVSFLLGFIPKRNLAEARPLAVIRSSSKGEQANATLRLTYSQHLE